MKGIKNKLGRFIKHAVYVDKECIVCKTLFKIKESSLKYGRGKYCSRKCCDEHKKILCVGNGNGAFGRKVSSKERKVRSDICKKMWENPVIKDKIKKSQRNFLCENGYWPGSDTISIQKRRSTFLQRYGVDHNWKVEEIRKKCDKTCLELYGKMAWQIGNEALKLFRTNIEIKIENILKNNKISFQYQYPLTDNGIVKIYDFYIPSSNLLIEADGDFWHGNPTIFPNEKLLEVQILNKNNDKVKDELATKHGYNIIRFWENDIMKDDFENKLLVNI